MSRSRSWLLACVALVGAGLTLYLALGLLRGQRPIPAHTDGGSQGAARPFGGSTHPGMSPGARTTRAGSRGAGGEAGREGESRTPTVLVGSRKPYDDASTRAFRTQASARAFEILNSVLKEPNGSKRIGMFNELQSLLRKLGHNVDPALRARLLQMLGNVDDKWKRLIGECLGSLEGDETTAKKLLGMLKENPKDVYTQSAILVALGKMNVRSVVPDLVAMIGHGKNDEILVRAIGRIGGHDAAEGLFRALATPLDPKTKRAVIQVLDQRHDPQVLSKMVDALPKAPPAERAAYVEILGASRDQRYSPALRDLLAHEDDPVVRRRALTALGMIGDADAVKTLVDLAQRDGSEASYAANALARVTNEKALASLTDDWDKLSASGRTAVMSAWSRQPLPSDAMVGIAKDALNSPEERVRTSAARLLGRRGRNDNVEVLRSYLLGAQNLREQNAAFFSLLKIDTKQAAEAGLSCLNVLPSAQRDSYRRLFENKIEGK